MSTEEMKDKLMDEAVNSLRETEAKFYAYACACEIGDERTQAFEAFDKIRLALCVGGEG